MTDRIASIRPHLVPADATPHPWWAHKAYILVRVETTDGIVGWGECHNVTHRETAIVALVQAASAMLVGQPAGDVRALMPLAFNAFGQQRPGPDVYSAFAGIELALWDVLGKRLDVPVFQLLGGACHERVDVYANLFSPHPQSAEAVAEMAARQVAAGYRALKVYPYGVDTPAATGAAVLAAVRDAVGPDVGIAVDLWRHASPARALELARAAEPFDLLWLEDPFAPTDARSLRYLRDRIRQPLLTGETLATRRDFVELFTERAVDIVNPDICLSGLLELQAIAAAAEPVGVTVSPHNSNTMALGTAAALHAVLGLPNAGPVEVFPLFETALDALCEGRPTVEEGRLSRPRSPGLGIVFDEPAMEMFHVAG